MCLQPESTRVTYFLSVWPALPFQKAAAIPASTVSCFIVFLLEENRLCAQKTLLKSEAKRS